MCGRAGIHIVTHVAYGCREGRARVAAASTGRGDLGQIEGRARARGGGGGAGNTPPHTSWLAGKHGATQLIERVRCGFGRHELSEREQAVTLRRIPKRNKERLEALQAAHKEEAGDAEGGEAAAPAL